MDDKRIYFGCSNGGVIGKSTKLAKLVECLFAKSDTSEQTLKLFEGETVLPCSNKLTQNIKELISTNDLLKSINLKIDKD